MNETPQEPRVDACIETPAPVEAETACVSPSEIQADAQDSRPAPPRRAVWRISSGFGFLTGVLQGIVFAAGVVFVCVYLYIAFRRDGYPFELEWLESGMAHEVQRVLAGLKLYVAPSLDFVPFIYTPLYFYVCAGVCAVFGMDAAFPPMRAVSFAASIACFALIYLFVRRESRSRYAAFLAVGLYAATFRIGGAWFDTARVDSLLLSLVLASIYCGRFGTSRKAQALTGLLLTLAFLTKHVMLPVAICVLLGALILHGRRALIALAVTVVGIAGSTLLLDYLHGGWYNYYLFRQPAVHGYLPDRVLGFWIKDIFQGFGVAAALAILSFTLLPVWRNWKAFFYYGGVTCGVTAMAWVARIHDGGYNNVLMPAFAWIAVLCALFCAAMAECVAHRRTVLASVVQALLCLLCLAQFSALRYDVRTQIPSAADRRSGEALIQHLRETHGEVFIPYHNFLAALAGKKVYVNKAGVSGIAADQTHPSHKAFIKELQEAIAQKRFALIVLDRLPGLPARLDATYMPQAWSYASPNAFFPVTGMRTRPQAFLVPKPEPTILPAPKPVTPPAKKPGS
jgi:hypothetical protein